VALTIAPTWFDPSTAPPQITPFGMLTHSRRDGRPLPATDAPSLAESWKESPDGKVYEFTLRKGLKFHNGDPITAEDVKFSSSAPRHRRTESRLDGRAPKSSTC